MSDRKTFIELVETDLDATGKALADKLFQAISQEMTASFEAARAAHGTGDDWADENLVVPGLAFQTFRHLEPLMKAAAVGWSTVFWANLAERYEATGEA